MGNLFKKAIVFTDLHLGLKSNSKAHNSDCLEFVNWVIEQGKLNDCETCIFTGDWHHSRASININTLNYSLTALEKLSNAFSQFFFIPGNHDLYYRDRRDVQSAEWARNIKGITIVNDFFLEDNVSIVPWLIGDESKKIPKIEAKYMFGHFELPNFYMNAMVQMPDSGELRKEDFKGTEQVFSGHFHKRQHSGNITYIGNAFPHNYADSWDDNRGVMILKWGEDPIFMGWPDAPKYRTIKISELLDDPDKVLGPKTYARITLDIDISYEEANYVREKFMEDYNLRELTLLPMKQNEHINEEFQGEINFESVDTIVSSQLQQVESDFYDPKILLDIYRNL